jgi:hypothetical protein
VTVQKGPDNASVEHSRVGLVVWRWAPAAKDFPVLRITFQAEPEFVVRPAAEAAVVWGIVILKTGGHGGLRAGRSSYRAALGRGCGSVGAAG